MVAIGKQMVKVSFLNKDGLNYQTYLPFSFEIIRSNFPLDICILLFNLGSGVIEYQENYCSLILVPYDVNKLIDR